MVSSKLKVSTPSLSDFSFSLFTIYTVTRMIVNRDTKYWKDCICDSLHSDIQPHFYTFAQYPLRELYCNRFEGMTIYWNREQVQLSVAIVPILILYELHEFYLSRFTALCHSFMDSVKNKSKFIFLIKSIKGHLAF